MMRNIALAIRLCLSLPLFGLIVFAQQQQFATIGDLKLENGGVIRQCRIGYRTFGKLAADKSNVVVYVTWASGTSEQLAGSIGPGKLIDSSSYYVIAIDALGNGVSSSPSNSRLQPRMRFPKFTIRDTVESQHTLLTKVLKLDRVKAVVGISMGGMQVFQWLVSYPTFMEKAVPIVGSPQSSAYDLIHWQAEIEAIMRDRDWNGGNYAANPSRAVDFAFGEMILTTPSDYNRRKTREQALADFTKARADTKRFDANDKIRQVQSMIQLDVAKGFGGSLERAAQAVKAKVLVVVAKQDHIVTPEPASKFAVLLGAKLLNLEGDCGHLATVCEGQRLDAAVAQFLKD